MTRAVIRLRREPIRISWNVITGFRTLLNLISIDLQQESLHKGTSEMGIFSKRLATLVPKSSLVSTSNDVATMVT